MDELQLNQEQNLPHSEDTITSFEANQSNQHVSSKNNNWWVISLIFVLVAGVIFFGFKYFQLKQEVNNQISTTVNQQKTENGEKQVNNSLTDLIDNEENKNSVWKTYSHPTYGYQFKYPPTWKVAINKNAKANVLFGPNASNESGIGGIEIREIDIEPENFNSITESRIISQEAIIINSITGYKTYYSNIMDGANFVFKNKDGLIYNIYINSDHTEDLEIFDQILSTFEFVDKTETNLNWENYTENRELKFTVQYPNNWTVDTKDGMYGEKGARFNSGKEMIGSVSIGWNPYKPYTENCTGNLETIELKNKTIQMCHHSGGTQEPESFYFVSIDTPIPYEISTSNYPGEDNLKIIKKILTTLSI